MMARTTRSRSPEYAQNVALAAMLAALEGGKNTIDATAVQQAVVDLEAV